MIPYPEQEDPDDQLPFRPAHDPLTQQARKATSDIAPTKEEWLTLEYYAGQRLYYDEALAAVMAEARNEAQFGYELGPLLNLQRDYESFQWPIDESLDDERSTVSVDSVLESAYALFQTSASLDDEHATTPVEDVLEAAYAMFQSYGGDQLV